MVFLLRDSNVCAKLNCLKKRHSITVDVGMWKAVAQPAIRRNGQSERESERARRGNARQGCPSDIQKTGLIENNDSLARPDSQYNVAGESSESTGRHRFLRRPLRQSSDGHPRGLGVALKILKKKNKNKRKQGRNCYVCVHSSRSCTERATLRKRRTLDTRTRRVPPPRR